MKRIDQSLIFIFFMLFASTAIAQVSYEIRHDTVAAGGIYNLTQSTNAPVVINDELKIRGRMIDPLYEKLSLYLDPAGKEVFEPVYIEDTNLPDNINDIGDNALLLQKYNVSLANNVIPPDPTLAVGPNHVIVLTNNSSGIFIYDKQGNLLRNVNSTEFWAPAWPSEEGDPQIIYDHYEGRWVIVFMQINETAQLAGDLIAYSDDDDPFGTWYSYRLPSSLWGDFPQIGFDHQGIYIATNCFSFTGYFQYPQLKILSKEELYASNGGPITFTTLYNITVPGSTSKAYSLRPSFQYSIANDHYLLWASSGGANFYGFYKLSDPISDPVLTGDGINVTRYYATPDAVQLGGETAIDAGGSHIRNAPIYRDGYLYAAHSTGNAQGTRSNVRYFIVDVGTSSIPEFAEFGADNYYYIYPALAVDKDENILITCSRSATTEYMGSYYLAKRATDVPGLSNAYTLQSGLGYYVITFGGDRNRWGDYLGIFIDPVTEDNFWMVSEYASGPNAYAISVGEVRLKPLDGINLFVDDINLDFSDVEIETNGDILQAVIANYGTDQISITSMPDFVGEFQRVSAHSLPIILNTYDSLTIDFRFSPVTAGAKNEFYPISNNSSSFTGFNLSGWAYEMHPGITKQLYAISGVNNGGNLLLVDKNSGTGTNIGPSSFSNIIDLTMSPSTGQIYGLTSTSLSSQILRINSSLGDAYELWNLDLPDLFSIAFNNQDQLYCTTISGDVYSIDLSNGTYNYISTLLFPRVTITFNQLDNQLWGSIKTPIGVKDRIAKFNITTGDTLWVGFTGFGVNTNNLVFDEAGVLYGIKGSAIAVSDLFTIDQLTGQGTLVGSVGLTNLTGIGYSFYVPSPVESEGDLSIPKSYSLEQNFPNPFNPATTINFSLPTSADVKLTVYNLLGETIRVLVDNQMSAGNHSVVWNANDNIGKKMSSGIYFYELKASSDNGKNFNQIRKMILAQIK